MCATGSLFHKVFLLCLLASPPKPTKQVEAALIMFNKWPNRHMCSLAYKTLSRCYFPGIQLQTTTHSGKGPAYVKYLHKVHKAFHPVTLPMAQRFSQMILVQLQIGKTFIYFSKGAFWVQIQKLHFLQCIKRNLQVYTQITRKKK